MKKIEELEEDLRALLIIVGLMPEGTAKTSMMVMIDTLNYTMGRKNTAATAIIESTKKTIEDAKSQISLAVAPTLGKTA